MKERRYVKFKVDIYDDTKTKIIDQRPERDLPPLREGEKLIMELFLISWRYKQISYEFMINCELS